MSKTLTYGGTPGLYPKQRAAIFDPTRISIIESSTKSGKCQPLDALVYTPSGPIPMRDVAVGQEVLTPTGTAHVAGVFPQGERDIFRVTFSDGASTECSMDHLWEVVDRWGTVRVLTLAEIAAAPHWRRRLMAIPRVTARFSPQPVPIHPYLLGAIIGDGSFRHDTLRLSSADEELLAKIRSLLPEDYVLEHTDRCNYRIGLLRPYQHVEDRLIPAMKKLGLWGCGSSEKFIPEIYRFNSEEVRLEVLRGLLDTDGFVNQDGQPGIDQTSRRLALDIAELVQGLGGFTKQTTRIGAYTNGDGERVPCKRVYRTRIVYPNAAELFTLSGKVARCRDKIKPTRRTFRKIEFSRRAQAQCIMLDDPRGIYLTDHMIATHNTVGCLAWLLEKALIEGRPERNYWWVAPVFGQAEIGFRRMKARLPRGWYKQNQSSLTLTLVNGARIWFKSGERPDDLYGEDVWAVVMDEASRMREEAWHAIRSTLTATRGPVRIIGNVKGRKNWFYTLARAAESGDPDMAYHRITCWDAVDAGVLDREEIEASQRDFARLGKEGAWRQLYMAEAADDGDNPFGLEAIRACIVEDLSIQPARVAGVDLAGRGAVNLNQGGESLDRDYTAIVMLDRDGAATYIDRFRKPHTETTAEIVKRVGRIQALVDSTGTGDAIVEALQRRGDMRVEGYTFTDRSRQDLLEGLALAIGERAIRFPDGALRAELESFEYDYRRTGVRFTVPSGQHDDIAFALALAVRKLPWRRRHVSAPSGVPKPGGSVWVGQVGEGQVGSRAEHSLLGDRQQGADPDVSTGTSLPVPTVITGPTSGRWGGADR